MTEKNERVCSVPGCGQPHHARGLCQKHYDEMRKKDRRARRLGSGTTGRERVRVCSVPECNRPHHARGYCKLHYARLSKSGTSTEAAVDESNPPDARRDRSKFLAWRLQLIRWRHKLMQADKAEEAASELGNDD